MFSRVIVEPPVEPLTLAEVKAYRRVDFDDDDALLLSLITAARKHVENFCGISLVTQTRETLYDYFPLYIQLDYGPIQSIASVDYIGTDGVSTALTDYTSDLTRWRLAPSYNGYWPTVRTVYGGVTVRYVAGFAPLEGSPTDYTGNIPADIKAAMQLLIGNWYENREATITGAVNQAIEHAVTALLAPHRMRLSYA
jgi:uncharacterized phiE125 gp8 family phage protein